MVPGDKMSLPVWSHVLSVGSASKGYSASRVGSVSRGRQSAYPSPGGQTNARENITFPQLRRRAVTTRPKFRFVTRSRFAKQYHFLGEGYAEVHVHSFS